MARTTSQAQPKGGSRVLRDSQMQDAGSPPPVKNKKKNKPVKSNISNKLKPRRGASRATSDNGNDDEDEGEDGDVGEAEGTADEPDVSSLPGVSRGAVAEGEAGLAGFNAGDDYMIDDTQAQAGAEHEGHASDDDDDYADVENVSDSEGEDVEEDENDILRSAEQDLIDEFERTENRRVATTMMIDLDGMDLNNDDPFALDDFTMHDSLRSGFNGLGLQINLNDDPFLGIPTDASLYNDLWNEAETAIWRMPETARNRRSNDSTQKRVRFEEVDVTASSSSSSEDPNEAFPDLFTPQDDAKLNHHLSLGLEQELEIQNNTFNDTESFYDFEDEDEKFAFEVDEESDSECDSSTYDSDDDGDATDEESREEQIARLEERKKACGKTPSRPSTPSMAERAITATPNPSTPRPVTPKSVKGLKLGSFVIDPTRAAMTTDSEGRKIKVLPPSQPLEKDKAFWQRARTAHSTRTDTPPGTNYITMPSPGAAADDFPSRPFTAKSTLGSLFNGDLDILRNNDASGIAEVLFPDILSHRQSSFTATTTTDDSETDHHTDINMQDFLTMDGSESESEDNINPVMTPSAGDDAVLVANGLLDHFDRTRGVVGSFRHNQYQARHMSSLASNPTTRASTHEFNAMQKGKRGAANTPMTPARKSRISQDLSGASHAGIRKSMSSPLSSRRPRSRGNSLAGAGIHNADLLQTLTRNPFH